MKIPWHYLQTKINFFTSKVVWILGALLIGIGFAVDYYRGEMDSETMTAGDWVVVVGISLFIVGIAWYLFRGGTPSNLKDKRDQNYIKNNY